MTSMDTFDKGADEALGRYFDKNWDAFMEEWLEKHPDVKAWLERAGEGWTEP